MEAREWEATATLAYRVARSRGVNRSAADDIAQASCVLQAERGYKASTCVKYTLLAYWRDCRKRQASGLMEVATTPAVSASETLDGLALTHRESLICDCLMEGMSQVEVASHLQLSTCMVSRTISEIRAKVMQ